MTTPEVSAIRDADRVVGKLAAEGKPIRLIVNRLRPEMVRSGDMLSVEDVCEILSIELLGIVPDDEEIIDTTNRGEPVVLDEANRLRAIYDKIARRLEGETRAVHVLRRTGFLRAPHRRLESGVTHASSAVRQRARARAQRAGRQSRTRDRLHVGKGRRRQDDDDRQSRHGAGARGARVVLVDADVGLRNLDIVLGLESRVKHHLLDVLEERAGVDDALVPDKHSDNLFLLAAAQSREKDDVETEKMQALIATLRERFDYVLIDCPAGIELGFRNAVAGADEAIVICTPEVSAVRDVDRVVGLLGNRFRPQLIVNRLRPASGAKGQDAFGRGRQCDPAPAAARRDRRRAADHRDDQSRRTARACTKSRPRAPHITPLRRASPVKTCPPRCRPLRRVSILERLGSIFGGKRA